MNKLNKFKEISKKNFLLLWRSKKTVLTVFLGPLILIFLLGLGFNNSGMKGISIASYSEEYGNLSNSLMERLKDNGFAVLKTESREECIENIKQGKNHICMLFPADFDVNKNNKLIVYLDKSKVNLAENIINLFSHNIKGESFELGMDLTEILLEKINQAESLNSENIILISELEEENSDLNKTLDKINEYFNVIKSNINKSVSKIDELRAKDQQVVDSKKDIEDILSLISESKSLAKSIGGENSDLYNLLTNIEHKISKTDVLNKVFWDEMDIILINLTNIIEITESELNEIPNNLILAKRYSAKIAEDLEKVHSNLDYINTSVKNIEIKEASKIVNPISTEIKPIASERSYLGYIFPSLLVMVIMFGGVLLSSIASIVEKNDRAFFRNFISPTNNLVFLGARYFTDFIIVLFQLFIFFGISLIFLEAKLFTNFSLPFILLVVISFFVLTGILTGSIFNSEEGGVLFSLIITSIMLFFSNTILPLENMNIIIQKIAKFNPFVLAETALRKSIIYELGLLFVWKELLLMILWIVIVAAAILIKFNFNISLIKKKRKVKKEKNNQKINLKEKIKNMIFVEE